MHIEPFQQRAHESNALAAGRQRISSQEFREMSGKLKECLRLIGHVSSCQAPWARTIISLV